MSNLDNPNAGMMPMSFNSTLRDEPGVKSQISSGRQNPSTPNLASVI